MTQSITEKRPERSLKRPETPETRSNGVPTPDDDPNWWKTFAGPSRVPKSIAWLWRDRLALGKLTILDGDPDVGKSLIMLDCALRCVRGDGIWPSNDRGGFTDNRLDLGPRHAIIFTTEDDWEDTMLPRLMAMGATDEEIESIHHNPVRLSIPDDMVTLRSYIQETKSVFVGLDPLSSYVNSDYDIGKSEQGTRHALEPLTVLARDEMVAVLANRHTNKKEGARALDKGTGSRAVGAVARINLMAGRNPNNPNYRVLAKVKANLSKDLHGLSYQLMSRFVMVEHVLTGRPVQQEYPYIRWDGESTVTADQIVAGPQKPKVAKRAADYIEELLDDNAGEMRSTQLEATVLDAGYTSNAYQDGRIIAGVTHEQRDNVWWTIAPAMPRSPEVIGDWGPKPPKPPK